MEVAGAVAYLESLGIDAMKKAPPTLHRIEAICEAMNHPEASLQVIHVTGTNGKTSTARIATALLAATGLSVGTYTSPHLQTIRERIALNGDPISEGDFEDLFEHLRPYLQHVEAQLGEQLTFFEVLTAMFFLWGAEAALDAAVVEVGLGGLWDATNVVNSSVAVITNVSLDHVGLLGATKEMIAAEKSGIIKPHSSVLTAEVGPEASAVIREEAEKKEADLAVIGKDFEPIENRLAVGGRFLSLRTSRGDYEELFLPLHGSHQGVNAAVAAEAVVRFLPAQSLAHEVIADGMGSVYVPGRLETLRPQGEEGPTVVLDVAHNPDGMSALVNTLSEEFAFERAVVALGVLADKDFRGMLSELSRLPCMIIATRPHNVRSVDPKEIQDAAVERGLDCEVIENAAVAVQSAMNQVGEADIACVTGSHYLVGEARSLIAPS